MSLAQRIVVRAGAQADIPALLTAEIGWDYDKKTLRMGDNTNTPPKIMSTKSLGDFDFSSLNSITFSNILQSVNATFNGMDLASLNTSAGILVRSNIAGKFVATSIVSGDGTISITNGDGTAGSVDVRVDPDLLTAIGNIEGVVSVGQPSAPSTSKPGDLWVDTDDGTLYIRTNTVGSGTPIWMDISSVGGAGANHTSSTTAPTSPSYGDEWYSRTDEVLFVYTADASSSFWMQVS